MLIRVTCALIQHRGKWLAAQRRADQDPPLKWEFPGGKLEAGESETEGLIRKPTKSWASKSCPGAGCFPASTITAADALN